jgi:hypothetical protein
MIDAMELYNTLARKPFQPVRVVCNDGRSFVIPAREFAVVCETLVDIGWQAPDAPEGLWGGHVTVILDDVARVDPCDGTTAKVRS